MAIVSIQPVSRFATPGSSVSFKVRAEGSEISTVRVVPCREADQYEAQLAGGGLEVPAGKGELTLTIEIPAKAQMA